VVTKKAIASRKNKPVKKALFMDKPPKIFKPALKTTQEPPAPTVKKTKAASSGVSTTFRRAVSEPVQAVAAPVQAKVPMQEHGGVYQLVNSNNANHLPPHLAAFIGAVFQFQKKQTAADAPAQVTPKKPPAAAIADPVDLLAFASHHVHVDYGSVISDGMFMAADDATGGTNVGIMYPPPPRLEAKHSLCIGDHHSDMELVKEFDPVAAWHSLSGGHHHHYHQQHTKK